MAYVKLTQEVKDKILADYHIGKSQNQLAKDYGRSPATINKICKGIEPKYKDKVNTVVEEFNADSLIQKYGLVDCCMYLLENDVVKCADKINDIIQDDVKSKLVVLRQFRESGNNEKLIFLDNTQDISDYQLITIWKESKNQQFVGSSGEIKIEKYLQKNNIEYKREHVLDGLDKKRFDFYIPSLNTCIEFDGKQHFEPIDFFGGVDAFLENKSRDKMKNDFCSNNNINIIRIPYYDYNNIDSILNKAL